MLAGAGVSKGAGLPSAWEIEVDLVTKIARQVQDPTVINDDNAEQWYRDRFGKPLTQRSVGASRAIIRAGAVRADTREVH